MIKTTRMPSLKRQLFSPVLSSNFSIRDRIPTISNLSLPSSKILSFSSNPILFMISLSKYTTLKILDSKSIKVDPLLPITRLTLRIRLNLPHIRFHTLKILLASRSSGKSTIRQYLIQTKNLYFQTFT